MLSFEIGQRESGFYSEETDRQNHGITEPSSIVLLYRYSIVMPFLKRVNFAHVCFKFYLVAANIVLKNIFSFPSRLNGK